MFSLMLDSVANLSAIILASPDFLGGGARAGSGSGMGSGAGSG